MERKYPPTPPPENPPASQPRPKIHPASQSPSPAVGGIDYAAIKASVAALRPEWNRPAAWNSNEEHGLFNGAGSQLAEMNPDDWELLRDFMGASLRPGDEKLYWRPRNRSKFVETFADVFSSAQAWARTNRKPARTKCADGWK